MTTRFADFKTIKTVATFTIATVFIFNGITHFNQKVKAQTTSKQASKQKRWYFVPTPLIAHAYALIFLFLLVFVWLLQG